MSELNRRQLLGAVATASATGLAGCLDSFVDSDSDGGTGNDDQGEETPTPDGQDDVDPAVVDYSTETTTTGCAADNSGGVEVEQTEPGVVVTGTMETPDPCHAAVIDSATIDGGELSVTMTAQQDTDTDTICQECLGSIEYEATIELEGADALSRAVVSHDNGSEYTVALSESASSSDITVQRSAIDTIETTCGNGEDAVEVRKSDGQVTVDGDLSAPNPCQRARLESTTFTDGELSVSVRPESALGEDEVCQQCLGRINYEATVEVVDTASVTSVTVDHDDDTTFNTSFEE